MTAAEESAFCRRLVDAGRYAIDAPGHPARQEAVRRCRRDLEDLGCAVLPGFLSRFGLDLLREEALARRPCAYYSSAGKTNVYFSDDDPSLSPDHPRRMFTERTNAFITSDHYGDETSSRRLYRWPALTRFIADCLDKDPLYIYDDPISNMIVNVCRPGASFNWHFDTNEFTITMLLKPASAGGQFEYVPNLRTAEDERYEEVKRVLEGDRRRVVRLDLRPGDLQIFLGRFSLHRVTENTGVDDRLLLIMSYAEKPGMIGSLHRTRELYGKITAAHMQAGQNRVRSDALLD
ncbi:MAG: hypothetical protein R3174_07350 [Gammaproteobacteria bacterium]|nr:hypothetical protein [Gammaproteobacteria bacterium]